ncbi:uncharacterized protein DUF4296 [Chitinophaga skermanii]|uniref:Uncharacterized protein DUF4296 n=1 Tax=Chitinophaga skermanii TaxID=331697 RepID=A0A327Q9H0_9BACT|nr:DUF4296 domain-containing protein [Chitinophaga skermanii]RAI98456.1 uncharacterized protein DUF4296 [Chitinophaga skermanii]
MRKLFFVLTAAITLAACGDKGKVPSNIIQQDKMSKILFDMNLADVNSREQELGVIIHSDSVRDLTLKTDYLHILQIHNVSVEEFMESYRYYESHADKLREVYDTMLVVVKRERLLADSLEAKRQEALRKAEDDLRKKKVDSVKKIYGDKINADSIINKRADSIQQITFKKTADSLRAASLKDAIDKKKQLNQQKDSVNKRLRNLPLERGRGKYEPPVRVS